MTFTSKRIRQFRFNSFGTIVRFTWKKIIEVTGIEPKDRCLSDRYGKISMDIFVEENSKRSSEMSVEFSSGLFSYRTYPQTKMNRPSSNEPLKIYEAEYWTTSAMAMRTRYGKNFIAKQRIGRLNCKSRGKSLVEAVS